MRSPRDFPADLCQLGALVAGNMPPDVVPEADWPPLIARALPTRKPEAAFYLWARTPGDDTEYARRLYAERHVTVLPGSFLARTRDGSNPGRGFVRIALVAGYAEVVEAAHRIAEFAY
jgi:N-succinyldiaminopimelate aminotransferase